MSDIIGHQRILQFFDSVITHGNLSHAYCFVGPKSVGKKAVAERLASQILNIDYNKLYTSPDFSLVERSINEKTGKTRKDISIDQIRNLISILSQSAFAKDGYKVAVVDEADIMSVGASNALLKTLEEPKKNTVLFIITDDESKLLPTIQSRCQMIYFSPVANKEIQKHMKDGSTDEIIECAHGLPGKAITWSRDAGNFQEYKHEVSRFQSLFGKNFYEKLALVEELFGDKTDHILARSRLQEVLNIWQIELHNSIKQEKIAAQNFVQISKNIKQARTLLGKNVHPRLLVEHILLQLP
ncbi:hypothetical protein C0581_05150 [Candidatus Parcubacteria bacterium]|nr:MAG: hypothetical protein C0581_05150 [Candidatus Parcubacteria bacterium]